MLTEGLIAPLTHAPHAHLNERIQTHPTIAKPLCKSSLSNVDMIVFTPNVRSSTIIPEKMIAMIQSTTRGYK